MLDSLKGFTRSLTVGVCLSAAAQGAFLAGDFNNDCKVNLEDLRLLAAAWLSPPLCVEAGLIAHWKLDGASADPNLALDSSGNGRTGTLSGQPVWRPAGGWIAGALELDGVDDYVQITGYKGITGKDPRTCSAWIKTYHADVEIITWGQNALEGARWVLRLQDDGFLRLDVGTGFIEGSTYLNDGMWHHIAAVYDGTDTTGAAIFVDGFIEIVGNAQPSDIDTAVGSDVSIGVYPDTAGYFRGVIDDVRIYDRALTIEQIWSLARTDTSDISCVDIHHGDGVDLEDFARMASNWLRQYPGVVINEFMADNEDTLATQIDGQTVYPDWIELYNPTAETADLGGMYLTDNRNVLDKWRIPDGVALEAGAYLVVFASSKKQQDHPDNYPFLDDNGYLHTNFSLGRGGEYLALVAPDGETIIHEYYIYEFDPYDFGYPPQDEGISYGMFYNEMRYFAIPTPGAPNNGAFAGYVADTKFSHKRGFYDGFFDVAIRCGTPNATIRYTTDGSEPTEIDGQTYESPIRIDRTTVLRAMAYRPGWVESNVDTQTYILIEDVIRQSPAGDAPRADWPYWVNGQTINYGMDPDIADSEEYGDLIDDALLSLPSISIVTALDNLFDPQIGIYVNARRRGIEWERPASLELLDPDGDAGFHINAGIRIRGGYSRSGGNPKHAFRLFFRGRYGSPKLQFPLFGGEGADAFDKMDLRTSQNYSWSFGGNRHNTMCREVFSRDMQRRMGQPYTRSRYYHLYLNGQYWGLFQTQERSEARYAASYFGGDVDDYDTVKVTGSPAYAIEATDGNLEAFERLWNACNEGFSTDEAYYRVQGLNPDQTENPEYEKLVDVDNLIDYMISTFYVGDGDAPISSFLGNNKPNNFYGIYNRANPDGFKFFRHDAEHSLGVAWRCYDRTGPYPAGATFDRFNPQWLHQRLTANTEYRFRFADRVCDYFFNNGLLSPDTARADFLERADRIDMAIIAESARWGDSKTEPPRTKADWLEEIRKMTDEYFPERTDIVLGQLRPKDWYPSVEAPFFLVNDLFRHRGHITTQDYISMQATEGKIFYTTDGADPRLPENDYVVGTETLIAEDAPKRLHIPTDADDGFSRPPTDHIAHWKFDNNYLDSSPNVNDGSPFGNVTFVPDRNADENNAVTFDGKDDFVYIETPPESSVFDITDDITITCWVKYSVHHPQAGIVTKGLSSWMLCQAGAEGKLRFQLADVGNLISDDAFNDDQWHHVAAVRYADVMVIYVDGKQNGWTTIDPDAQIPVTWWWVFIGSNYELWYDEETGMTRDIDSFAGEIDDVRIYDRALMPDEIDEIMRQGEFWASANYDDSAWRQGTGGVGFDADSSAFDPYIGTDVRDRMYTANSTCCIRIPFTLDDDPEDLVNLLLQLRYDDGFVAYINGKEVARRNLTGTPQWDSAANAENPDDQAVQFEQFDISAHLDKLQQGENILGIQGLNRSASNTDFLISAELILGQKVTVSESAILYDQPFTLDKSARIKARSLSASGQWSALNQAPYAVGVVADNLRITEIMYHPADTELGDPNSEFIELQNTGQEPINLNLVRFTDGIDFTFPGLELEPGAHVLVVESEPQFRAYYKDFEGVIAGQYTGSLDNAGEKIRLADAADRTIAEFKYDDDWWEITDGEGFSLTVRNQVLGDLAALQEDLAAHWPLDDRHSPIAPDRSGNDHTGILIGAPLWRYDRGRIDGAMLFDGIDDYVDANDFSGVTGAGDRTCAAWIRTDTGGPIMAWGTSSSGGKWILAIEDNGLLRVDFGNGHITGSTVINDEQWHHVAVTNASSSAADIRLYVDGRFDPPGEFDSASVSTASTDDVSIGAAGADRYFRGLIDDVRIYDVALDDQMVERLFESRKFGEAKQYWRPSAYAGGSPGEDDNGKLPEPGDIQINEVLAHSHDGASDWIELHNTTDSSISIGGWYLTDDKDDYTKFQIPAGVSIGADGYVVFVQNDDFDTFALSENGETVVLRSGDTDGSLTGYYEEESFGASETDIAFGRYLKSTGTYNFVAMAENTRADDNADPLVGPVVISEIMYNPPPGETWDHNEYEYIELLNISQWPVSLRQLDNETGRYVPWRFTDGIDFELPLGTVLQPGGRLLVVKNPVAFAERYGDPGVPLLGPYDGRLDNNGEKLTLSKPGDAVNDRYYYIRLDRVSYDNQSPWPMEANGGGKALVRTAPSEYGNDPVNWQARDSSYGQ